MLTILGVAAAVPARAQGKTDVATLSNGDRITGEVEGLDRGRLEFDTDDAGTLFFEWEKLLTPRRDVARVRGRDRRRRALRRHADGGARPIHRDQRDGRVDAVAMKDVVLITPIGRSFWSKLDGSIDAGFSYTKSSGIAQFNLNSETVYRKPAFAGRLFAR